MNLEKIKAEAQALKNQLEAPKIIAEEKRLAQLQAEIIAEEKRLNSKEYKTALETIDGLAVEAEAKKQTVLDAAEALKNALHDWKKTVMERRRLAAEHVIQTKDLYNAEAGKLGGLLNLENHIMQWFNDVHYTKALEEKHRAKPAHSRSALNSKEYKRMMEERFPENEIS